jgi:hypothetical protein
MALTKPVLLIVAIEGLAETQAFEDAAVPDPESCEVVFGQSTKFPVIVGEPLTVMVLPMEHPLLFVKVIVVDPAETPVTRPVFEMVAIEVLLDVHGFVVAAVPFPVNCKVAFSQTDASPEIAENGFTVIDIVAEFAHCPVFGVKVYVVVAVLLIAGDHVPVIGVVFVDEVGSADKFAPGHIAGT